MYNSDIHPNGTIAFVIAKAFCPPNNTALDAQYHIVAIPGNQAETE